MFRTVAFMVEEDIADRKFEKLIDLRVRFFFFQNKNCLIHFSVVFVGVKLSNL